MQQRLIGYLRVAPRERVAGRPSLARQQRLIEEAAAERGFRLGGFEQDVRSGRTLRRSGLRAAFAACREAEADGIVVARLDRLTYSLADLAAIVREAREAKIALVALDPPLDLTSECGQLVADVLAEAASWRPRGLPRAGATGTGGRPGRPSSTPPALAGRIRSLRAGGATLQAICDILNTEGIPTPHGGTHWRPTSLRAILRPIDRGGQA